jgi:hypothetical protein
MSTARVNGFIKEALFNQTTTFNNVGPCCREVKVHRYDITGFDKCFGQNMFTGSSLMSRKKEGHVKEMFDTRFKTEEGFTSRIRIIG